jgi:hypothetical protein
MASIGASTLNTPIQLPPSNDNPPAGLFIIKSGSTPLTTYAIKDNTIGGIAELVRAYPNQTLTVSLIPLSTGEVTGTFLNDSITFSQGNLFASIIITTPEVSGRYILKTPSSPIPLVIEVSGPIQPSTTDNSKPWRTFNWVWNSFK